MKLTQLLPLALLPVAAMAAPSPWSVAIKSTYLETVDGSNPFTYGAAAVAKDTVSVENKVIPEIDVNYQINDQLSLELVLTIPQEHTVTVKGVGELGDFKHLPPCLLAKYSPGTYAGIRPYVGAGVNFTLIFDESLVVPAGVGGVAGPTTLKLDNYSVGAVVQVGASYAINDSWSLVVDVKRVALDSAVTAGGAKVTTVDLDPWLFALGATYSF